MNQLQQIQNDSLNNMGFIYYSSEGTRTTTNYFHSGYRGIEDYDQDCNLQAYYIPGLGIDRIEIMHKNNTDYYFVRDHLGSVRLVLDSDCNIVEQYEYSTYGELMIKNPSGQTISESIIGNRHTYTGREWDEDLCLYYYRARWYDPKIRRFTQKDIIHYSNRYIYVINNPVNYKDLFGLCTLSIDGYGTFYPPMMSGDLGFWVEPLPEISQAESKFSNVSPLPKRYWPKDLDKTIEELKKTHPEVFKALENLDPKNLPDDLKLSPAKWEDPWGKTTVPPLSSVCNPKTPYDPTRCPCPRSVNQFIYLECTRISILMTSVISPGSSTISKVISNVTGNQYFLNCKYHYEEQYGCSFDEGGL